MPAKKMVILVVEDDPRDYALIERSIKALEGEEVRYELHWAKDGQEALDFLFRRGQYAEAPKPNLILLDLRLPKVKGFKVLEEVKKDEALRKIPVVVLTVSDYEEDMVKAYDSGAAAYLKKPAHIDDFERLLKTVWDYWKIVELPE